MLHLSLVSPRWRFEQESKERRFSPVGSRTVIEMAREGSRTMDRERQSWGRKHVLLDSA